MKIVKYSSHYYMDWNQFVNASKMPLFMFNRDYMDYHADRFTDHSLMFYDQDNKLVALLPANIDGSVLRSHGGLTFGGILIDDTAKMVKMRNIFISLRKYCCHNNIERIIYKAIPHIYHLMPAEDDIYNLFVENAKLIKVEPSTTIYIKRAPKMSKGRKSQIARAKRLGVRIERSLDFMEFMKLENEVLLKRHAANAVHTGAEMAFLQLQFPSNIKLYVAKYQEEIIAGVVIYEYETVVHTQYMAANDKAREIGALDYVVGELIKKYEKDKLYFDFGISTEDQGRVLNEGLISQKEGFGGRGVMHQTFELGI